MSRALIVHSAGPGVSVQDKGRPGYLIFGLSRGGASDRLALAEGAALLGQSDTLAALEMAGSGGAFEVTEDMRFALTGAPMRASLDGERLAWNASHLLPKGAKLSIGAVEAGSYGYLSVGGGIATPERLGARSTHFAAGIGGAVKAGERLPVGPDSGSRVNMRLPDDMRFDGGTVRIVPSLQTEVFDAAEIDRFAATAFTRDARANRMGMKLLPEGEGFKAAAGLTILSEVIVPGDIQITGDGTPFVLLAECQTTGGYPRIGSVLPVDLPRVAQAPVGATLRFRFVTLEEAVEIERTAATQLKARLAAIEPLVRDPRTMGDLLSYQLVSGVTDGETFV